MQTGYDRLIWLRMFIVVLKYIKSIYFIHYRFELWCKCFFFHSKEVGGGVVLGM